MWPGLRNISPVVWNSNSVHLIACSLNFLSWYSWHLFPFDVVDRILRATSSDARPCMIPLPFESKEVPVNIMKSLLWLRSIIWQKGYYPDKPILIQSHEPFKAQFSPAGSKIGGFRGFQSIRRIWCAFLSLKMEGTKARLQGTTDNPQWPPSRKQSPHNYHHK